ncbi:LOW QUALITY PROTEIN: hypothetical protein CRUP_038405, partial [Coryphaenoides rupestris]
MTPRLWDSLMAEGGPALEPGRHGRSCCRCGPRFRSGSRSRSLSRGAGRGYCADSSAAAPMAGQAPARATAATAQASRSARARDDQDRKQELNVAFDDLRRLLPVFPPDRTLSKLEILIHAMGYIFCLNDVLNDEQPLTISFFKAKLLRRMMQSSNHPEAELPCWDDTLALWDSLMAEGGPALEPGRHGRSCCRCGPRFRSGSRSRSLSLSREVRRLRHTAAKSRSARARDDQDRKQELNVAFDDLRRLLPVFPPDRTLSKLEILIHAMGYIFCLNDVLNDEQPL